MFSKFTAHKPKPRKAPVDPLQAAPKAAGQDAAAADSGKATAKPPEKPKEVGGPSGPEPTRYGDWERKGICVDF